MNWRRQGKARRICDYLSYLYTSQSYFFPCPTTQSWAAHSSSAPTELKLLLWNSTHQKSTMTFAPCAKGQLRNGATPFCTSANGGLSRNVLWHVCNTPLRNTHRIGPSVCSHPKQSLVNGLPGTSPRRQWGYVSRLWGNSFWCNLLGSQCKHWAWHGHSVVRAEEFWIVLN